MRRLTTMAAVGSITLLAACAAPPPAPLSDVDRIARDQNRALADLNRQLAERPGSVAPFSIAPRTGVITPLGNGAVISW